MKKIYYIIAAFFILTFIWSSFKLTESLFNLNPLSVSVSQLETQSFYWTKLVKLKGTANFELSLGASLNPKGTELRNIFMLTDKSSTNGVIVKFVPDDIEKERLEKGKNLARNYFAAAMELQKKIVEYNLKIRKHNESMIEPQKKVNAYQEELKSYKVKIDEFNTKIKEHNAQLMTLRQTVSNYYYRLNIFARDAASMSVLKRENEKKSLKEKKTEIEKFGKSLEGNKAQLTSLKGEIAAKERVLATKKKDVDKYIRMVIEIKSKLESARERVQEYQLQIAAVEKELKKLMTEPDKEVTGLLIEPPTEITDYLSKKGVKIVNQFAIQKDAQTFPLGASLPMTILCLMVIIFCFYKSSKIKDSHPGAVSGGLD